MKILVCLLLFVGWSMLVAQEIQLSPHFLFNNLNVLISTIQEDPEKSEQFARSFSKIYRYVLARLDESSCVLSDELAFIQDYLWKFLKK
ncbi:histidine kinase [Myroides sp. C15-4]|uniref:histidine kinase n=1 Tax=Myroides sp. C15-4 TaxID=3400532 RepID=UPI003D2F7A51